MPGGWTMSMAWMRMPGQTWIEATCVIPRDVGRDDGGNDAAVAWCQCCGATVRRLARTGESHLGRLTLLAGLGYFFVWTLFGLAVFPLGVALAAVEMEQPALARAAPVAVGVVILIAGAVQFTSWKSHHLACCRETPARGCTLPADAGTAWRQGLRFGLHCGLSCANLTAILLVDWGHGSTRNGCRDGSDHRRTARTGRRARRASDRSRCHRGRVVADLASDRPWMTRRIDFPGHTPDLTCR